MIEFGLLTGKNIMSYGSGGFELDLSSHKVTLITGKNGASKSSIIEALTYALYGKPYRKIKLAQLINSINGKGLLVTINFKSGIDEYLIKRGMKPTIFEIYKNGVLIPEDSASKDYQKMLEEDIIGFGYKTFKQICVIGSSSYVQFMSLEAKDRRLMIEELLDSSVYSEMAVHLKKIVDGVNKDLQQIDSKILSLNGEIKRLESILMDMQDAEEKRKSEYQEKLNSFKEERSRLFEKVESMSSMIEKLTKKLVGKDELKNEFNDSKTSLASLMKDIEDAKKTIKFFEQTDHCSVCQQEITQEHRDSIIGRERESLEKNMGSSRTIYERMEELKGKIASFEEISDGIDKANVIIRENNSEIRRIDSGIEMIMKEMERKNDSETVIGQISAIKDQMIEYQNKKASILSDLDYLNTCSVFLKDSGIKSAIVARYIPLINSSINEYLTAFDLFVNFELDENFNETIKSRYRDSFSYESFSNGEKLRLDLSILFSWRQISKDRNSASCNLLFFDETLDSALDNESIEIFLSMLRNQEYANVIIISHRGADPIHFDRIIKVEKNPSGFGTIKEEN